MKKIIYLFIGCFSYYNGLRQKTGSDQSQSVNIGRLLENKRTGLCGCTAIYNALTVDGSYMRSFPGLTDSRGDDFTGDSPWLDLVLTGQFIIPTTSAPVFWIWREFYLVVNRANQVIANVGKYDRVCITGRREKKNFGTGLFSSWH